MNQPLIRLDAVLISLLLLAGCQAGAPVQYVIDSKYGVADPQFRRTMGNLLGPSVLPGNTVQPLRNGEQIFPAMLAAIQSARKTITFETFIYWSGKVGRQFSQALCERAAAGVKVHIILDWVGSSRIDREYLRAMKKAGIQVVEYHPLHWYDLGSAVRLNNRTHRKLLVVDGKVGFTGGVGIADLWTGDAESTAHWRDMHYRVEGPVVAQLQASFLDNWMKTTGHILDGEDYFPPLVQTGPLDAQVFKSGAHGGSESMELMYLLSLAAAKHNVYIGSAYFVPDDLTMNSLIDARRRGVRIQIIVPGPNIDVKIVRRASRARWGELLKSGVEIYEYQPTMYHTKLLIVDDLWVSIGSSNLDDRSFRLNDEANLDVLNAEFAQAQRQTLEDDLRHSKVITFEQWQHRPLNERMLEGMAGLLAPLL